MGCTMYLKHVGEIHELSRRYSPFSEFENKSIWEYNTDDVLDFLHDKSATVDKHRKYRWNVRKASSFHGKHEVSFLTTMFIGKTGYGKSSLLNRIIGKQTFPVDDVSACTNQIDAAVFQMDTSGKYYLALSDLPGIGESAKADAKYLEMYRELLPHSECVVYTLRADQRDFSVDERLFREMMKSEEDKSKIIIALNCADKIEPTGPTADITSAQERALREKVKYIADFFNMKRWTIIPCCSQTGYGVDRLVKEITEKLSMLVYEE